MLAGVPHSFEHMTVWGGLDSPRLWECPLGGWGRAEGMVSGNELRVQKATLSSSMSPDSLYDLLCASVSFPVK